jgi:hypothetical protein
VNLSVNSGRMLNSGGHPARDVQCLRARSICIEGDIDFHVALSIQGHTAWERDRDRIICLCTPFFPLLIYIMLSETACQVATVIPILLPGIYSYKPRLRAVASLESCVTSKSHNIKCCKAGMGTPTLSFPPPATSCSQPQSPGPGSAPSRDLDAPIGVLISKWISSLGWGHLSLQGGGDIRIEREKKMLF